MSKQWTIDDINYNLCVPWPLIDLDEQGWACDKPSILPSAKKVNIPTFKTIRGAEFNYKTGEINFILDYCKDSENDYNRLLTTFDLNELFQRCLTSAIFSLDPVDPDMSYHPFNQMRFAPSTLYHSQMLHTMLLTDYLLKFLTVGQEVQRCDPYKLRSLDRITSKLPNHLKKVIYDFHTSNHKESLHRFWIESEKVELAIDDEGLNENGNILFALGNIHMVVKQHKMKRDAEGNLVDKEGENEGWDCFILTLKQKRELYNGKRVIKDPAIIIIKESLEFFAEIYGFFWENNKEIHSFTLKENRHNLIYLGGRQRNSEEKVKIDDTKSLRLIYEIVRKAAEKTGMPHHYSPEFIFAQEFTKYYNEFAIYFPEFGRLRELSKAVSLVNTMAAQHASNQEEIHLIRKRLSYFKQFSGLQSKQPCQAKEQEYWQTTRQRLKALVSTDILKQFEEWRSKFSREKIKEKKYELFKDLRQQIGTLEFTRSSPEIQDICDTYYAKIRRSIIDEHGFSGWNSVSHKVYREAIEPHIPKFIADLRAQKKAAFHKQLSKLFEDELNEMSEREASQLLDKFLEGNGNSLHERLVCYDSKIVAKKIQNFYPEHTINDLDKALNNCLVSINKIVDCETEKALKMHEDQLKIQLIGRDKLKHSFINLGFEDDPKEVNLEGTCSWVPASFRHDVEGGHSRMVYGGVCIAGLAYKCIDKSQVKTLLKQTDKSAQNLWQNKIRGDTLSKFCEEIFRKLLSSDPRFRVKSQYRVQAKYGLRIIDLTVEKDVGNGKFDPVAGIEIKAGNSRYTRPDSMEAQKKKPTKQGMNDAWIEKKREKEGKGKSFPIQVVRVEKLCKNYCKIQ